MNSILIIVPTYNESGNFPRLLEAVRRLNLEADLLIVDDASPDGTGRLAEKARETCPWLHVLHRPKKDGIGTAHRDGLLWGLARPYEIFIQMDADLSHDPNAVPLLLEKIQTHDAVFGSRFSNGVRVCNWSFRRLLLSKCSNEFIRRALNLPSTDTTTAFKCFRRRVLEQIGIARFGGRQNAFLIEEVYWTIRLGFNSTEIPFMFMERETGESKMSMSVAMESLRIVCVLWLKGLFRAGHQKIPAGMTG